MSFSGIRGSPPLHRQLSSPRSQDFSFDTLPSMSPADVSKDSKEVLMQRLADLSSRLAASDDLEDEDFSAMHVDVDRLERVLREGRSRSVSHDTASPSSRMSLSSRRPAISNHGDDNHEDIWGTPSPLSSAFARRISDALKTPNKTLDRPMLRRNRDRLAVAIAEAEKSLERKDIVPLPTASTIDLEKMMIEPAVTRVPNVGLLAIESEKLQKRLTTTLEEMKIRRDEANHIHDLLISQCKADAQRASLLEEQIKDIHDDHVTLLSKLSFLRIQLRALEVQGFEYIPFNADAELSASINNWKLEWADVDMRVRNSKRRCEEIVYEGLGQTLSDAS